VPYGSFEVVGVDAPLVVLYYLVLFGVTALGVRRTAGLVVARPWLPIVMFAVLAMFVWTAALASPDSRTHISFVAAPGGDATLIRTATDHRILVNGTDEPGAVLSFLGEKFPPWDRRLDVVITTHLDNANLASLNAVLERYEVGQVLEPPEPTGPGVSYQRWRKLIAAKQLEVIPALAGTQMRAGDVTLEVVYPTADSRPTTADGGRTTNVGLRVGASGRSLLLANSLTASERAELLASGQELDVEVAALPNGFEKELVDRMTPETVILFVGRRPQDKPAGETLRLLDGLTVLRTDERGTMTFVVEGEEMRVSAQK
jgi:beta-lactamase superfamily II metal-dependent hydrolase